MENLDALAKSANEHTQNGEYYNQVSEIIKNLIGIYTVNTSVVVIGTVTNIGNLNQRLYTSRGNQAYGKIYKISELSKVTLLDLFCVWLKKATLPNKLFITGKSQEYHHRFLSEK